VKYWKTIMITLLVVLLVGINLFLILIDDSKVEKTLYVNSWTSAREQDLEETMVTEGISSPQEEQYVYYDDSKGSFEGFMVKEGEEVTSGRELFYYKTDSYVEAIAHLEAEKESVQNQLDSLEDRKDRLDSLLISSSAGVASFGEDQTSMSETSIEIDIYETEAEISRLESELEKYEDQIDSIDGKLPYLHEISDIDGTVKEINKDLSNPVITIASNESVIEGTVPETQHKKLQQGLDVLISLRNSNSNKNYKGSIVKVSAFPEGKPSVEMESTYPFTVALNEPIEDLVHGAHVDVKIITEEVLDAITVPSESVYKSQLQVLQNGIIAKREVKTGLEVMGTQQIELGLEVGDVVVREPVSFEGETISFYTPLQFNQWEKEMYGDMSKLEIIKLVGQGILAGQ
jgi:HlyD family secretion protein